MTWIEDPVGLIGLINMTARSMTDNMTAHVIVHESALVKCPEIDHEILHVSGKGIDEVGQKDHVLMNLAGH